MPDAIGEREFVLDIEGMTCASCVRRIERVLVRLEPVSVATVSLATRSAVVRAALGDPAPLLTAVREAGYGARIHQPLPGAKREWIDYLRRLLVAAPCTFYLVVLSTTFHRTHHTLVVAWLLATPVQFYSAAPFLRGAWNAYRQQTSTMDTLVSTGSLAAYCYGTLVLLTGGNAGYFDTAAVIVTLVLVGKMLEAAARARAGDAVRLLLGRSAKEATVIDGTQTRTVVPEALRVGDRLLVLPGETIAADGVVRTGVSAVDLSMLTGESVPVDLGPGDEAVAGSLNGTGRLEIEVSRVGDDTSLARVARLLAATQASKPAVQRMADRIAAIFVPSVVAVAVITFLARDAFAPGGLASALLHGVAVLLVACPCSLGLATPTAIMAGVSRAGDHGILFKDGEAIEAARGIDTVVFDKTGTLTEGAMSLDVVVPLGGTSRDDVLRLVAAVEQGSEHPIARAVMRAAREAGIEVPEAEVIVALPGAGVRATIAGQEMRVGRPDGLAGDGARESQRLGRDGLTVFALWRDNEVLGLLGLQDRPKPEAKEVVSALRRSGYAVVLLSGDTTAAAAAAARQVGIDRVVAEVRPDGKVQEIRRLQREGRRVTLVGDGINDAPALAQADLGIALGTGTDVAIEAADVMVMGGDLRLAMDALRLARRTYTTIGQNLAWAFAYNTVMIPLAVVGAVSPMLASATMAASSVTVVSNALRLRRWRPRWTAPPAADGHEEISPNEAVDAASDASAVGTPTATDPSVGPGFGRWLSFRLGALITQSWDV